MVEVQTLVNQLAVTKLNFEKTGSGWTSLDDAGFLVGCDEVSEMTFLACDWPFDSRMNHTDSLSSEPRTMEGKKGVLFNLPVGKLETYAPLLCDLFADVSEGMECFARLEQLIDRYSNEFGEFRVGLDKLSEIGLIGELQVLYKFLSLSDDVGLLSTFRSPFKEDNLHDFQGKHCHIEVKTSASSPHALHTDLEQFHPENAASDCLYLITISLKPALESDKEVLTLNSIVAKVRTKAKARKQLPELNKLLKQAGYEEEHSCYYRDEYVIHKIEWLQVDESTEILSLRHLDKPPSMGGMTVTQRVNFSSLSKLIQLEDNDAMSLVNKLV